ncbi:MAG: CYTH domain-containing protein [Eubacterium sp.]|nr:CYTH domain-containing protein [Eubacterium sp.]
MEIEKKFLIKELPENIDSYPHHDISQGYISTDPVVRIRQKGQKYILTIKSSGLLARTEIEKALTKEEFDSLKPMVKGNIIEKTRYLIPEKDDLTIELDIFHGLFEGLIMAEVEFPSIEKAQSYVPRDFFSKEVTDDPAYQNSSMSQKKF